MNWNEDAFIHIQEPNSSWEMTMLGPWRHSLSKAWALPYFLEVRRWDDCHCKWERCSWWWPDIRQGNRWLTDQRAYRVKHQLDPENQSMWHVAEKKLEVGRILHEPSGRSQGTEGACPIAHRAWALWSRWQHGSSSGRAGSSVTRSSRKCVLEKAGYGRLLRKPSNQKHKWSHLKPGWRPM